MPNPSISHKRHRFQPQIITHAVWLYVRFNLTLREVEEILLERGVDVSYETARRWAAKLDRRSRGTFSVGRGGQEMSGIWKKVP